MRNHRLRWTPALGALPAFAADVAAFGAAYGALPPSRVPPPAFNR